MNLKVLKNLELCFENLFDEPLSKKEIKIQELVNRGLLTINQDDAYAIFKQGGLDTRCMIEFNGKEYFLKTPEIDKKTLRIIADIGENEQFNIVYVGTYAKT